MNNMAITKAEFRRRVSLAMGKKGLNQSQLAEKIGIRPASVSRILSGEIRPSWETLEKISSTLDLSIDDLSEKSVPTMKFGNRIRAARTAADISQVKLAEMTGISQAAISMYESDEMEISASRLVAIAKALRLSLTDLTGYRGPGPAAELQTAIRQLDLDDLLGYLKEKGFTDRAIRFIKLLASKKLDELHFELIDRLLSKE